MRWPRRTYEVLDPETGLTVDADLLWPWYPHRHRDGRHRDELPHQSKVENRVEPRRRDSHHHGNIVEATQRRYARVDQPVPLRLLVDRPFLWFPQQHQLDQFLSSLALERSIDVAFTHEPRMKSQILRAQIEMHEAYVERDRMAREAVLTILEHGGISRESLLAEIDERMKPPINWTDEDREQGQEELKRLLGELSQEEVEGGSS